MSDVLKVFSGAFSGPNGGRNDAAVAAALIGVVLMLIIPLPGFLLDVLLVLNLLISLLVILVVMYNKRALDFTIFPTLLLVTTIFGLALNISTTRLILTKGADFDGTVVRAFGNFVVGGSGTDIKAENLVVGVIIFIILIAVQFIVITKGATRVAEVAARFTLDALPGKQMAIDNSLSSGSITEKEAQAKKFELEQEVGFYGAMDGASKFVSGNVKVGLLITLVNIVGGLVVGMTIHGEPFGQAITTYTALTIGDGLVSQLPALLVSTATGLIVTRAISSNSIGSDVTRQFTSESRIYWLAAGFMGFLGLIPGTGLPWYIFLPTAILLGYLAFNLGRREQKVAVEAQTAAGAPAKAEDGKSKENPKVAPLDPLSLELGYGLIPLVDKEQGAELLERITRIRRETALDLGLMVPSIRIMDNMRLEPSQYTLKIKGVDMGSGTIRMGSFMAINPPGGDREEIPGEVTRDPAFNLPALWISEDQRDRAERAGYTVVDAPSIIATHLTEIIKKHASEILGRQEVQALMETLRQDYSAVLEEVQKTFSAGEVQKVLQALLKEQVSIRNLVVILETLGDYGGISKDTGFLVEKVRQALGRQICLQYCDEEKTLHVLTLDPALEQRIIDSRVDKVGGVIAALEPDLQRRWINAAANAFKTVQNQGYYPIILCSEAARPLVKVSTERDMADLVVISVPELAQGIRVESLGTIHLEER